MNTFTKQIYLENPEKTYQSRNFGDFRVIDYLDSLHVKIKFIETEFVTITRAWCIKNGEIKDKLKPNVYGKGFVGAGIYKTKINGKEVRAYKIWQSMHQRCYDHKLHDKYPTYIGCFVCEEWHDFQIFSEWFELNYKDGLHLDKDIKVKGNKVYSPSTCLFVSHAENVVAASAKHYTFLSPLGELTKTYNLSEFCRKHNLQASKMAAVNLGKRKSHKKWRSPL